MGSSSVTSTQRLAVRSAVRLFLLWAVLLAETWGQNQWLKKPQDVLVSRGGNVTFECQSPNNSTIIVWTQGPKVVFNNGNRTAVTPPHFSLITPFTLSITGVQDQDAGQYGCNVLDYGSVSAQLTVAVLPGPPSLTLSHLGDIFREGESISMTCQSVGGRPLPSITWMKNGVQLMMPSTVVTGNVSRSTLNITLNHSDHAANYTCFVYNLLNEYQPLIVSRIFNVQYSPIISFEPFGPYIVRLGQRAQLTCLVDANPPVLTVTWQKDDYILSTVHPVLSFEAVSRQDSGNYTCYASNLLNSATPTRLSVYINVVYPPNVTVPSSLTVQEGTPLSVYCTVDANPDPWEVKWEKINGDGSHVQVSKSRSLVMTNVSRGDQGNYSCQASNHLTVSRADSGAAENGESEATMTLFVSYPPGLAVISTVPNISIGQKLVLTCSADPEGYPSATFQWWKADKELYQNVSLVIDKVSLSDTGNYTCIPRNSQGTGLSAQVTVRVNEPPSLTTSLPPEMTDVINSSQVFNLTCRSRGHPKPTIQWFKDDMSLQDAKDFYFIEVSTLPVDVYSYEVTSVLTFKGLGRQQLDGGERTHLRVEDTGNYTCTATSPVYSLSVNSTVRFFVQFAPVQLSVVQKVAVMLSNPASLHCQVQAYPVPVFSWYRNGQQLTTVSSSSLVISEFPVSTAVSAYGSSLVINRVGAGDFGSYQCLAVNFMGNVTQTLTITTKSAPEAPFDLKVLDTTWESVHLQWTGGFDGGYLQQFKLQYQETGDKGSGMQEKPDVALNVSWYNVTGLKPSTAYMFAVFALNFLGASKPSTTITSQTSDLDIPHLDDNSLVFSAGNGQLSINYHLPATYCLKIQVQIAGNKWQTTHMCTELDSVALPQSGITAVNVSVCLLSRPDVCGEPTAAVTANPENRGILIERDVIIIACVCATIIVTLLIILVCFICRRRQANAKEYAEERESHPPPVNGSVSSKKPQAQTQPQVYNNIDSRYPAFSSSELEPPYWDMNARHVGSMEDNSFDSERERHMMELQLSRQNEAIYGSADGLRNPRDAFSSSTVLRGGGREKYIDLEEHQDPSLQSQESGYSTGDTAKPKKVIYEVVV